MEKKKKINVSNKSNKTKSKTKPISPKKDSSSKSDIKNPQMNIEESKESLKKQIQRQMGNNTDGNNFHSLPQNTSNKPQLESGNSINIKQNANTFTPVEENKINEENINIGINQPSVNQQEEVIPDEETRAGINKPQELKSFDAYSHFKFNLQNYNKNCSDRIGEYSYYCATCKVSICNECGLYEHKDHLIACRKNCLFYDTTFFKEIEAIIDNSLNIQEKKEEIISLIINSVEDLKRKLEEVKQLKIKEIEYLFQDINGNLTELKKNFTITKEIIEQYYEENKEFFKINEGNLDLENTVFLMNFEMMNLCDNKNLEVFDAVHGIKKYVNNYQKTILQRSEDLSTQIEHFLDIDCSFEKFDDFYWDIKQRAEKYSEHIKGFRKSIAEILSKTGNLDKIKNLLDIFEAKGKKGNDVIFNQEYFICNSESSRRLKVRGNSKSKLLTNSKSGNLSAINSAGNLSNSQMNLQTGGTLPNYSPVKTKTVPTVSPDEIFLDNRTVQRFFAYSILELFRKYFANDKEEQMSKTATLSVNFMQNYANRYNRLKEYAKPLIRTNKISVYNEDLKKILRYEVNLIKEDHGYSVFPEGVRHILVNNILYITGGVNSLNDPINICLSYDINTKTLTRLNNLNYPHSYHTVEYLEDYDCIIVVGGEHNRTCEIFDIYSKKWTKLPDMNFPRANVNVYYDVLSSDFYAMFGMKGDIVETKNNSDAIEVLELNSIKEGWLKVDYYKSADLNFKVNYCTVVPFTQSTLLIYGGNNPRMSKKLFALYNLGRNEAVKADDKVMEQIKFEEKKMKLTDMALTKIE
ncbi:MAG: hypothetical protein MJ252_12905 [archaeon]|nr:hypothetical protein [archaeon]